MPNPHFDITITQRSKGQSAVAGAAYQSGEKLFSEYDQKTKNYTGKRGILYTEIMLPSHAPPEYANRETLWNSVEAAEKQWNAQLARRFVLALPKEVPPEQYPQRRTRPSARIRPRPLSNQLFGKAFLPPVSLLILYGHNSRFRSMPTSSKP